MQHEQLKDFQNTTIISNKSFGIQLSAIFFIIFLIRLYFNFFGVVEIILILLSAFFITISYIKPSFLNLIKIIFLGLTTLLANVVVVVAIVLLTVVFVLFSFNSSFNLSAKCFSFFASEMINFVFYFNITYEPLNFFVSVVVADVELETEDAAVEFSPPSFSIIF